MDLKKKLLKEIVTKLELNTNDNVALNSPVYKISFIGTSETGTICAAAFIRDYIKPVHLCVIDTDKDKAKILMSDLDHCAGYFSSITISSSSDLAASTDSNIIIICLEPLPNQEPSDTFDPIEYNLELFKSIIPQISKLSPNAIFLNCTYPFNIITHIILKLSKFPINRVIGLGSCIETVLFHYTLAKRFKVSPQVCRGWIIGVGINRITVWSSVSIAGATIDKFITDMGNENQYEVLDENYDINNECLLNINKMPKFTLAAVTYSVCESIINDSKSVFPVSVTARGIHGANTEIYMSLPCVIGANGIHSIVEQNLCRLALNKLRTALRKVEEFSATHNNSLSLVYRDRVHYALNNANKNTHLLLS